MKKEYIRPELSVLSLVVEDNTNTTINPNENIDITLSINKDLGSLFGEGF